MCMAIFCKHLISILPKNHAGPVEKLIKDFFRMPKKVGAIDSLKHKSHITKGKRLLSCRYHGNDQLKILPPEACFLVLENEKLHFLKTMQPICILNSNGLCCMKKINKVLTFNITNGKG